MDLSNIIRTARKAKKMTQRDLAVAMGVGQGVISEWESPSKSNPRSDKWAKLSKVLEINLVAAMAEGQENWDAPDVATRQIEDDTEVQSNVISVPEYDIRLSAGGGYHVDAETIKDMWVFTINYIQELRLKQADLVVVEVEGDSMEPKLFSGDRVMINQSDQDVNRPGIFAIWDTSALVVKRIEKIPASDPPMLRLISDNPNHSKYDVLAEDTKIIGRIVWFARRL